MNPLHGCIDLQINGLGGIDFNQKNLSWDSWHRAIELLGKDGTKKN